MSSTTRNVAASNATAEERHAEQAPQPQAETAEPTVETPADEKATPAEETDAPETETGDGAAPAPVAGSFGYELAGAVIAAGIVWTPSDAAGSPIGAALAAEMAAAS